MRLTYKSRILIETIVMTGLDALFNAGQMSAIYKGVGNWETDSQSKRYLKGMNEKGWIVWDDSRESGSWVAKVTEEGKKQLKETIDPDSYWNQTWDGQWRTLSYDLPQAEHAKRKRLECWLTKNRFGQLQGSVRITSRTDIAWIEHISKMKIDPTAVFVMEGNSVGNLAPMDIVKKAWNFDTINQQHKVYQKFHEVNPPLIKIEEDPILSFTNWISMESTIWKSAIERDPLLPKELLPKNYHGFSSWKLRKSSFGTWREILKNL